MCDTDAPAICVFSKFALSRPASSTRTRTLGSSASLPATTQPAVPPLFTLSVPSAVTSSAQVMTHPQTMKSKVAPSSRREPIMSQARDEGSPISETIGLDQR